MKTPEERMEAFSKQLGARMRQRRNILALSLDDIAEKVGVSFQTVAKYEAGQTNPEAPRLLLIAAALKCNIVDLLPGASEETDFPLSEVAIQAARIVDSMKDESFRKCAAHLCSRVAQLEKEAGHV